MYRAISGDVFLVGITEDNVREILKENPLYVQNDDIGVPFDIQIALANTKAIGIEGRTCLTNAFSHESLEALRKGDCRVIERTENTPFRVLIFYGKDLAAIQEFINSALGIDAPLVEIGPHEFYKETKKNGETVVERGVAPSSIFRGGKSHSVF